MQTFVKFPPPQFRLPTSFVLHSSVRFRTTERGKFHISLSFYCLKAERLGKKNIFSLLSFACAEKALEVVWEDERQIETFFRTLNESAEIWVCVRVCEQGLGLVGNQSEVKLGWSEDFDCDIAECFRGEFDYYL